MSWIHKLCETYDNSKDMWGKLEPGTDGQRIPLMMAGQTTQNAQIEAVVGANAELLDARALDKSEQLTIILCTDESVGRTSGISPHPLHDKLQYIAGDYAAHGGAKRSGYADYMENLNAWCAHPGVPVQIAILRDYLQKGTLVSDLAEKGVILLEDGRFVQKGNDEQRKRYPLLANAQTEQSDAMVRFRVRVPSVLNDRLWEDPGIAEAFSQWQSTLEGEAGLCYVTGQVLPITTNHPAKLRTTADSAKLISANDSSGFTYRGRFEEGTQAAAVSYDASQKAHNMLRWLISRQGYRNDSQVFVAWGTRMQPIPQPALDSLDAWDEPVNLDQIVDEQRAEGPKALALRQEYALRLKRAIAGYHAKFTDTDDVVVMGLDSASKGRMSVIFYRELTGSDFLDRIQAWHEHCAWYHTYRIVEKKRRPFYGAPSPKDMTLAAYGENAPDKLIKATVERLMHCIVDGKPIPPGLRNSLVRRAGSPAAMEDWEWNKTLSIACAVISKHEHDQQREDYTVALDEQNKDRSYLFGRLLAYAQHIESYAQFKTENTHRQTNAQRMMHQFALCPAKTWQQLFEQKLPSYMRQLKNPGLVGWWERQITSLTDAIGDGFTNQALEERYLLGYSSQMQAFYNKSEKEEEDDDNGQP